jgi:hypothetical protein
MASRSKDIIFLLGAGASAEAGIPVSGEMITLGILPGEGSLTFSTPVYIGSGSEPGYVLAVNAHGQSPKSGKPDLITPDATGVINIFFNTTQ